ncbi:autophagy associated protein Atg16 [Schizosaccharomyces osmophilus]|uniref:Autophagy associated protein Atg16 n=1 Tax=Schizosaccharomyces osmophilus TaxID=2545709 RepID=A0AAF0AW79_9SCHI|nr:autophagy associated protein Atg16 [Schizosaccharomyces osmophilus]WBW72634.1 autophagy associated protein Atg16 [Schizosaccharomyces osmophilus]
MEKLDLVEKLKQRDCREKAYVQVIEPYTELFHSTLSLNQREPDVDEKEPLKEDERPSLHLGAPSMSLQAMTDELRSLRRTCELYQRNMQKSQFTYKQQLQENLLLEKQLSLQKELNVEKDKRIHRLQDELLALQLEMTSLERKSAGS